MFHGGDVVSDVRFFMYVIAAVLSVGVATAAAGPVSSGDPVSIYNEAVQRYQQSEFDQAAVLFQQAATSPDDSLAASARYNLGNARYAAATKILQQQADTSLGDNSNGVIQDPAVPPELSGDEAGKGPSSSNGPTANPIDLLRQAVDAYRSCLRLTPDDEDARFNLENSLRLIDQLTQEDPDNKSEDKDEKQQQQPSEQDTEKGDQDSEQGEQEQGQDASQDSDPDQSPEDEEEEGNSEQETENDTDESTEESDQDSDSSGSQSEEENSQDQEEQNPGSKADDEPGNESDDESGSDTNGEDSPMDPTDVPPAQPNAESDDEAASVGKTALTQQEASRLLQAIRDRDMQRRKRLDQIKRSRQIIVPRDW